MTDRIEPALVFIAAPEVPPGMVLVKQGARIIGAVCHGVVFGTADVERIQAEIARK